MFSTEHDLLIDAPQKSVFDALTTPEKIIEFWGEPGVYRTTEWTHEFRAGGAYRHATEHYAPNSGDSMGMVQRFAGVGEYGAIAAPHSLEYTRKYEGGNPIPEVTTIRFELEPVSDGKTRLRVLHSGFNNSEVAEIHRAGWVRVFVWLKDYLEKRQAALKSCS
jgi:uncharacterized protein YndB with AHSA1/START domain